MPIKSISHYILLCFLLFSFVLDAKEHTSLKLNSLKDYQWQFRILLINTDKIEKLEIFKEQLVQQREELDERKMMVIIVREENSDIVFPTVNDTINSYELVTRLKHADALLIGLDGGSKVTYEITNGQLNWLQVYADIDGMPMRRAEL